MRLLFFVVCLAFGLMWMPLRLAAANRQMGSFTGELVHVYEEGSPGSRTTFIIVADSLRRTSKFEVDPKVTLTQRGDETVPLEQLTSGVKVVVLYRQVKKDTFLATLIRVIY